MPYRDEPALNSTPADGGLNDADVRLMVALLSETCRHAARRKQIELLMGGLCDLIDAKAWVWGASVRLKPDALPTWILHQQGGFTDEAYAKFVRAQEHPDMGRLTAPFAELLARKQTHLTRSRDQTDPRDTFQNSPAKPLWDAAGVSPGIMSCRPLKSGHVSGTGIFRGCGERAFGERERRIAHILLTEVPWLHMAEAAEVIDRTKRLSPRRLTVFNLLIEGQSRREIGERLGIRRDTVNSYTKEVFRHFEVHSQAELIARFRRGDGNDGP